MENYDAALEQLRAHGLVVENIDTSGRIVRVDCEDRPGKKHGWYVAHLFRTADGREFVVGAFGDWRDSDKGRNFEIGSTRGLSESERAELKHQRELQRRATEAERRLVADEAAARAKRIWAKLPDSGTSDYLRRKGVRAHGTRFANGRLVVPLENEQRELVSLQFIDGEGGKKFLSGGAKHGACHWVGDSATQGPIAIAEGYATAATVHEATGWTVAVAFDAGNLMPVAVAARRRFPGRLLVLCADNDHATAGNPGVTRATQACERVGGVLAVPEFKMAEGRSDWNDLQAEQGVQVVRAQLRGAVEAHEASRQAVSSVTFDLEVLLRDFFLIHGTTFVWDGRRGKLMPLASLRVSAGETLVKQWLAHPYRRMVDEEAVVFDPADVDRRTPKINLFTGFEMQPDPHGRCSLLLEHLFKLCGERERLFDWVLKWIALPLQRPGTKMHTAIVMYGAEGTGKNLFWSAVLAIYGRWGVLIGQAELESSFNGWESAKLFMVADEVVPRNEMSHMKSRLKQLITSDRVMVNEKNLPLREERNCMNGVFLSNESQPLLLDRGDRRYCGIRCDEVQSFQYFEALGREIESGGAEAFYHYLLSYDLEGFSAHSKPFETDERAVLIESGSASSLRFWDEWREGELPLPYCSCRGQDLYEAYVSWCAEVGERNPMPKMRFGLSLQPYEGHWYRKERPRWATDGGQECRPKSFMVLDAPVELPPVQQQLDDFKHAADAYRAEKRKSKL